MDISQEIVKSNESNSGGAQYLLKDINFDYWDGVEKGCKKLWTFLKSYEKEYPIEHHIQSWTVDMWCVLWEYWKLNKKTKIHTELNFSWATCDITNYYKQNIFHLAGVTKLNCSDKFFKYNYHNKNIFQEYIENNKIFDHISPQNATYEYIEVLKKYVLVSNINIIDRFSLSFKRNFDGIYKMSSKIFFNKPVWRSIDNNYVIFHNKKNWILTHSMYESEFSENCGGFASNTGSKPYDNEWNIEATIRLF
jgi:hypothetical protein